MARPRLAHLLAVLSCLLTLAASGDDFCLPRLVITFVPGPSGPLPLDDPNSDFVETTDSSLAAELSREGGRIPGPTAAGAGGALAALAAASPPARPGRAGEPPPPPTPPTFPLRC